MLLHLQLNYMNKLSSVRLLRFPLAKYFAPSTLIELHDKSSVTRFLKFPLAKYLAPSSSIELL